MGSEWNMDWDCYTWSPSYLACSPLRMLAFAMSAT
jgi:hypothetical protein